MRAVVVRSLLVLVLSRTVAAQPADCPSEPSAGPTLPLSLDLGGRPHVPAGVTGQAYIDLPMAMPGVACPRTPAPLDVLRGEPGDVLGRPSRDLLRGPGTPRVTVEIR